MDLIRSQVLLSKAMKNDPQRGFRENQAAALITGPKCKHLVPPAPVGPWCQLFGATSQVGLWSLQSGATPQHRRHTLGLGWPESSSEFSYTMEKKKNELFGQLTSPQCSTSLRGCPSREHRQQTLVMTIRPVSTSTSLAEGEGEAWLLPPRFQRMGPSERVMGQGPQTQRATEPRKGVATGLPVEPRGDTAIPMGLEDRALSQGDYS